MYFCTPFSDLLEQIKGMKIYIKITLLCVTRLNLPKHVEYKNIMMFYFRESDVFKTHY